MAALIIISSYLLIHLHISHGSPNASVNNIILMMLTVDLVQKKPKTCTLIFYHWNHIYKIYFIYGTDLLFERGKSRNRITVIFTYLPHFLLWILKALS